MGKKSREKKERKREYAARAAVAPVRRNKHAKFIVSICQSEWIPVAVFSVIPIMALVALIVLLVQDEEIQLQNLSQVEVSCSDLTPYKASLRSGLRFIYEGQGLSLSLSARDLHKKEVYRLRSVMDSEGRAVLSYYGNHIMGVTYRGENLIDPVRLKASMILHHRFVSLFLLMIVLLSALFIRLVSKAIVGMKR